MSQTARKYDRHDLSVNRQIGFIVSVDKYIGVYENYRRKTMKLADTEETTETSVINSRPNPNTPRSIRIFIDNSTPSPGELF